MTYFSAGKAFICLVAVASSSVFSACSSGNIDDETAYRDLGLYRTADLPNLVDSARNAVETGKILIVDEKKFNQIFDADPTRFNLTNLKPISITVEAYSSAVRIEFFVADSVADNGEYAVVTVRSESKHIPVVIDCSFKKLGETLLNKDTGKTGYFYSPEKHGVCPPIMPDPGALARAQKAVDAFINDGKVRWNPDASADQAISSANDEWIACKLGDKPIRHSDLLLRKIEAGKNSFIYSYCVNPLIVRNSPDSVDFHFITIQAQKNGTVTQIGSSSVTLNDATTVVPSPLTQEAIDTVYETAFRYMFKNALPGELRSREEKRLIVTPFNASANFTKRFESRFSKPLADAFDVKTTRYSISFMVPVDSETAFVTGVAVNDIGTGRVVSLKIEKSMLFGWSVVSEKQLGNLSSNLGK